MKSLRLEMSEHTFSGIMAYRDLYGSSCSVRESAERMLAELISSKEALRRATKERHERVVSKLK